MNLSKIFIERPVATTHHRCGHHHLRADRFPDPAGQRAAQRRFPDHPGRRGTARAPTRKSWPRRSPRRWNASSARSPAWTRMNSVSSTGRTRITLQFSLERDIDSAAQDVQTAISQAMRRLPDDIDPPTLRKVNPADVHDHLPGGQREDAAAASSSTNSPRRTSRSGCRRSTASRRSSFSARRNTRCASIVNPEALAKRGLGLDKVVSAIQNANSNLPSGVLQGSARNFTVKSSGKLERAEQLQRTDRRLPGRHAGAAFGHRPGGGRHREREGQELAER